jgi:sigma-E factor negative regulatory protein RseB
VAGGCAVLWVGAGAHARADEPRDWLTRIDRALATRNYEGIFVHEHAGETETLRVIHRVGSDGVSERLLSMDGSGREFISKGSRLTCYLPDRRTVLVEKTTETGLLLGSLPHIDASSAGQYQVTELQRSRVSGREARVIAITPMDELRYGYRVWIDEATAMPLKTQLRNGRGEVLEQIVFTDLRLPAHIPDSALEPAVDARSFRWIREDQDLADTHAPAAAWQASSLPPGFRMTASARQLLPGGPVEHLVFSDGLASVSVFVETARREPAEHASDDAATLGSSSAFSTFIEGYRVTAVGEVPPDTVRAIARSIRSATAPAAPSPMPRPAAGSIFDAAEGLGPIDSGRGNVAPIDDRGGARVGIGVGNAFSGSMATGPGRR